MTEQDRSDLEQLLVCACDLASAMRLFPNMMVGLPDGTKRSLQFVVTTVLAVCERNDITADVKDYGGDPAHALALVSDLLPGWWPDKQLRDFEAVMVPQA